jgi:NADPH:quinone reductase-like Zn-dependent oxidoreductase
MNAAVVHSFKAPPRYDTFADPVAADGEVLIRVSAVGLHQAVKSLAGGSHYAATDMLPFIPGVDGVGRFEDGQRTFFGMSRMPFGTFAEQCVTERAMCLSIPDEIDDVTMAAMMNPGMSSWMALTGRAQFVAGESVLILGATGVAGQMAVQIAKRLGARRVVAGGRNPQVLERLSELGADAVISLNLEPEALVAQFRQELAKDHIDVVLDYVWGKPAEKLMEAIAGKGMRHASRVRYIQIGAPAGPTISLAAATLRSSGLELLGSGFGSASLEKIFQAVAEFLREAAKQPFQIKTRTAPLSEVEALWNAAEHGVRLVFQP